MKLLLPCLLLLGASVPLEWHASPDSRTEGYRLVWGSQSGSYDHSLDVGDVTCWDLSDLAPGPNFIACLAYGHGFYDKMLISDPSNEVAIELKPHPPQNTRISGPGFATVEVSWQPSMPDIIGYRVYKSLSAVGPMLPVLGTTTTSAIVPGLLIGETTWFYVIAVNQFGDSPPSEIIPYTP